MDKATEKRELGVVEDTLFVPMLGRIYASENCPEILMDEAALSLKAKLPKHVVENDAQTQYTYLASASRSANMDRFIADFIKRKPDGIVVQLGCGLETTYFRGDNGSTLWYGVDLPHVVAYRKTLLPEGEREHLISSDAFSEDWLREIRSAHPDAPLLITASGLFYYFPEKKVLELVGMLRGFGDVELLFDTVNRSGMTMMRKKHMKTVGHADAEMFFYVDDAWALAETLGDGVRVLAEERFYKSIPRAGLEFGTRVSMSVSDLLNMVKMVHLAL